jgi:uncharacterized protein (TIGR00255 family)
LVKLRVKRTARSSFAARPLGLRTDIESSSLDRIIRAARRATRSPGYFGATPLQCGGRPEGSMIRSMTAFARLERPYESGTLVWEMRSVNHRYLEVSFRLPDSLREVEFPLRDLVRARLNRGKVDCTLRVSAATTSSHLEIDRPVLLHLLATLEQLRRDAPEIAAPDPLTLLGWPGVLAEPEEDIEALKSVALEAFAAGLDRLEAQRAREGEEIARVVVERLAQIEALVGEVAT